MSSPTPIDRDTLFRLFGAASEGTISEADSATLEQHLTTSAEARKLWFIYQDMDLGLDEWAASRHQHAEPSPVPPPSTRPPQQDLIRLPRKSSLPRLAIAAIIAATLGIMLWGTSIRFFKHPLASITGEKSALWASQSFHTGSSFLSPQPLDLTSGIVELSMSSGTLVVFEGPGRMDILSENSVHLHSGRLHATVPPAARGFTVNGDGFAAIDHGTRFGCAVSESGPAEIHVFQGEVELKPARQPSRWMHAHKALAIHRDSLETITARPELFVSPGDLDTFANNPDAIRARASLILKKHPAAVLHLDATDTAGAALHHTTLTAGRDPGRKALHFDGISSHLSLALDHQSSALTLLAWVRCENTRKRQDLVSATGRLSSGSIVWYLHQSGALGFGAHQPVRNMPNRGWRSLHSTPLSTDFSDWSLLAVVADAKSGTVTHFLNGKAVGMGQISLPPSLRLGPVIIGATTLDSDSETPAHPFHGSLDELAIIAAPLTEEEISRLYELGRPSL